MGEEPEALEFVETASGEGDLLFVLVSGSAEVPSAFGAELDELPNILLNSRPP